MTKTLTTSAIAAALDGELIGDGALVIGRVAHPADIQSGSDLALAMDNNLLPLLAGTAARAAVVSADGATDSTVLEARIVVKRPRLAMAKLTNLFAEIVPIEPGIHPTAVIEPGAILGANVAVGAQVYIAASAVIGANSVLHPQVYIGPHVVVGKEALIYAGVKIGRRVQIGDRCIIHFNTSIGADGFSFVTPELGSVESAKSTGAVGAATNHELVRIASLGSVVIGDDVEIGANTSIDRGTIAATRIGNGTKIDNQVQIGHNVVVGDNCLICGRVGIAGSAVIGNRVVLGGAAGVADHVKIGDDAIAMAMSGVASNIPPKAIFGGFPARPRDQVVEQYYNLGRLKNVAKQIEALTARLDALESKDKSD